MKKIILLSAFVAVLFYACKEEEINSQQFVQNYIVGKWPLKVVIAKTTKNGIITKNDTVIYGLDTLSKVDTLQYTAAGKYIKKKGDTLNYTIDNAGEHITYNRDSIGTWNIKFLRLKSIILTQEKTEKIGSDTFIYYKEQQLIK